MKVERTDVLPEESGKLTKEEIKRGAEVFMLLLKWEQEMKLQEMASREDICMS